MRGGVSACMGRWKEDLTRTYQRAWCHRTRYGRRSKKKQGMGECRTSKERMVGCGDSMCIRQWWRRRMARPAMRHYDSDKYISTYPVAFPIALRAGKTYLRKPIASPIFRDPQVSSLVGHYQKMACVTGETKGDGEQPQR